MGTGYRGTIEQLSAPDRARVYEMNAAFIEREGIGEVETNVVYAVAARD
jgi:hypothetical protein